MRQVVFLTHFPERILIRKATESQLHIITLKGADDMPKSKSTFNVILHPPETEEDTATIQAIIDKTFVKCIARRLEKSNLTSAEKCYVIRKIAEQYSDKA